MADAAGAAGSRGGILDVDFEELARLLELMEKEKSPAERAKKRKRKPGPKLLTKFRRELLGDTPSPDELFGFYRLMMPAYDKERQVYNLKEAALAKAVGHALSFRQDDANFLKLTNWRAGGTGNFAVTIRDTMEELNRFKDGGLTVGDVNGKLDELATADSQAKKQAVLRDMLSKMSPQQGKWLMRIILKDLKIGMRESTMLRDFHFDGEETFNVNCDLRAVLKELAPFYDKMDPKANRRPKQDVTVGNMLRAQLANRKHDIPGTFKSMRGKPFVVECKFDGERIQVHKSGSTISYYTRNMNDFGPRGYATFDEAICAHVKADKCVLDGEMCVYNTRSKEFEPFGILKAVMLNAKRQDKRPLDPLDMTGDFNARNDARPAPLVGDLQIYYIPFDILYVEDRSVIDRTLRERHEILRDAMTPGAHGPNHPVSLNNSVVKGCVCPLLPGDSPYSTEGSTMADIEKRLLEELDNKQEGVVVKSLESKWVAGDRSGTWIKLKPDYFATEDLDLLIVGGLMGTGHARGGKISEFLTGIAERPQCGGEPTTVLTFCKVGTGFNMQELDTLRRRLEGNWITAENKVPPKWLKTSGTNLEAVDFWIKDPTQSYVVSVKGDVRLIRSRSYAAPYHLRFPRCQAIRYDKRWHEIFTDADLELMVSKDNGVLPVDITGGHRAPATHRRRTAPAKRSQLPSHLMPADITDVEVTDDAFASCTFFFVNTAPGDKERLERLVVSHGGTVHQSWNETVTHMVAANRAARFEGAKERQRDILSVAWLERSAERGELLPVTPKDRLHFSVNTALTHKEDVDTFGDSFTEAVDEDDVRSLLQQAAGAARVEMQRLGDDGAAALVHDLHCEYHEFDGSSREVFRGCCVRIVPVGCGGDAAKLAGFRVRSLELDVLAHGGETSTVAGDPVTHLVAYWPENEREPTRADVLRAAGCSAGDGRWVLKYGWVTDSVSAVTKRSELSFELDGGSAAVPPPPPTRPLPQDDDVDMNTGAAEGEPPPRPPALHRRAPDPYTPSVDDLGSMGMFS